MKYINFIERLTNLRYQYNQNKASHVDVVFIIHETTFPFHV